MFKRKLSIVVILAAICVALSAPATLSGEAEPAALLINERAPLSGVLTGGARNVPEEFDALAAAGYVTYVDLRSDPELAADVAERAAAAGLDYLRIPVTGEGELDLVSVRALDAVLDDESRYPVVVACGSGNRSGALLALRRHWLDSAPPETALALGLDAGLTRLAPTVRLLLGLPPAPTAEGPPGAPPKTPANEGKGSR